MNMIGGDEVNIYKEGGATAHDGGILSRERANSSIERCYHPQIKFKDVVCLLTLDTAR